LKEYTHVEVDTAPPACIHRVNADTTHQESATYPSGQAQQLLSKLIDTADTEIIRDC
jgi:hypothetical protein